MNLPLYNAQGKRASQKVVVDDAIFGAEVNKPLMRLVLDVYLGNQRQSTAHTKSRGEVRGGGRKPWAQKGTGRARHGSIRSPIWKGGGVAFGQRNERNYRRKVNLKMRKGALRSALSYFVQQKKIIILQSIALKDKQLTKQILALTKKLPVKEKVLYIHDGSGYNLYLGSRNLKDINVIPVNELNLYTLLRHDSIVILQNALGMMSQWWGQKEEGSSKKKIKKEIEKKALVEDKSMQPTKRGKKRKERIAVSFSSLKVSTRVKNALEKQGITSLSQLRKIMQSGEKIKGVGEKSLDEIKKALK